MEKLLVKSAEFTLKEAVLDVLQEAAIEFELLRPMEIARRIGATHHVVYGVLQLLQAERKAENIGYGSWRLSLLDD